jgi:hypothetical protein
MAEVQVFEEALFRDFHIKGAYSLNVPSPAYLSHEPMSDEQ